VFLREEAEKDKKFIKELRKYKKEYYLWLTVKSFITNKIIHYQIIFIQIHDLNLKTF